MSEAIKASCPIAGGNCDPNECGDCAQFPVAWGRFIESKRYGYNKPAKKGVQA